MGKRKGGQKGAAPPALSRELGAVRPLEAPAGLSVEGVALLVVDRALGGRSMLRHGIVVGRPQAATKASHGCGKP